MLYLYHHDPYIPPPRWLLTLASKMGRKLVSSKVVHVLRNVNNQNKASREHVQETANISKPNQSNSCTSVNGGHKNLSVRQEQSDLNYDIDQADVDKNEAEWKYIAAVIDRLLFWLMTCFCLSVVIVAICTIATRPS